MNLFVRHCGADAESLPSPQRSWVTSRQGELIVPFLHILWIYPAHLNLCNFFWHLVIHATGIPHSPVWGHASYYTHSFTFWFWDFVSLYIFLSHNTQCNIFIGTLHLSILCVTLMSRLLLLLLLLLLLF